MTIVLDKSKASCPLRRSTQSAGVIVKSIDFADEPDLPDVADEEVSRVNVALENALPNIFWKCQFNLFREMRAAAIMH